MRPFRRLKNRIYLESDQFIKRDFGVQTKPICTCGTCSAIRIPKLKKDIAIIYSRGTSQLASIQMRLVQSAGHLKYINPNLNIKGFCLQSSEIYTISNSNIILTKFALENISNFDLLQLSKNNTIFADIVDLRINTEKLKRIDKVIASSNAQFSFLRDQNLESVDLIYHTADFRLRGTQAQQNFFSIAYFGSMSRIPQDFIGISDLSVINTPLSYEAFRKKPIYAKKLTEYSSHLVVGTSVDKLVFKPFTKGLIASSIGATTLISKDDSEAMSLLGQNYPYITASKSRKSVENLMDFMRSTFLKEEWFLAQAKHRELLKYCCELRTLNQWTQVLNFDN
jgi:hypothetical protein